MIRRDEIFAKNASREDEMERYYCQLIKLSDDKMKNVQLIWYED